MIDASTRPDLFVVSCAVGEQEHNQTSGCFSCSSRLFSICNLLIPLHLRMMIILLRFVPATFSLFPHSQLIHSGCLWERDGKQRVTRSFVAACGSRRLVNRLHCHVLPNVSQSPKASLSLCHTITRCDLRMICFTHAKDKLQTHTYTHKHTYSD